MRAGTPPFSAFPIVYLCFSASPIRHFSSFLIPSAQGQGEGVSRVRTPPHPSEQHHPAIPLHHVRISLPPPAKILPNSFPQSRIHSVTSLLDSVGSRAGGGRESRPHPAAFSATVWSRDPPLSCVQMPLPSLLKFPILGLQHHSE